MLPDGHCRGYVTSPTATYGGRRRREMPAAYWPPGRTSSGSDLPGCTPGVRHEAASPRSSAG